MHCTQLREDLISRELYCMRPKRIKAATFTKKRVGRINQSTQERISGCIPCHCLKVATFGRPNHTYSPPQAVLGRAEQDDSVELYARCPIIRDFGSRFVRQHIPASHGIEYFTFAHHALDVDSVLMRTVPPLSCMRPAE